MKIERTKPSLGIAPWLKAVLIVIVAAASVSALRLSFNLGYYYRAFECTGAGIRCPITVLGSFLLGITLGLVVSAVGLWWRTVAGVWLSFGAVLCEVLLYVQWYRTTRWTIQVAEVSNFWHLPNQQQRILPLNDATWWDLAVLALVIVLLVWHVKVLVSLLKRERN
jgi:hypothetical protein